MTLWGHGLYNSVKSEDQIQEAVNKEIADIIVAELNYIDTLQFVFTDDSILNIMDRGQDCCEVRYMHTDDTLTDFIGATFLGAELRDGPTDDVGGEFQESQFLIIQTSTGEFTVVNYNEHNGYYGGFNIVAEYYNTKEE